MAPESEPSNDAPSGSHNVKMSPDLSGGNANDKAKSGRSATSCSECQRRKQKCSREWPCNHCQARKVPHLCAFPTRQPPTPESDSEGRVAQAGVVRKRDDESYGSNTPSLPDDSDLDLSDSLARLGYMPAHQVFALLNESPSAKGNQPHDAPYGQSEEVELALRSMLPKPYTDCLVQNYIRGPNHQYYPVFPPQLIGQSADWWASRAANRPLSPEVTCLMLRVCAVSCQYLESDLRKRLEHELGEKAQILTERFQAAADKLNVSITPAKGGCPQVQQLFLASMWHKSEAKMIEAWHALGIAVRQAQEMGFHKGSDSPSLSDFEREMRRRLWCVIWAWDWQMSALLGRPVTADQDDQVLYTPSRRLEGLPDPDVPPAFTSVALQATLGLRVSKMIRKLGTDISVDLVLQLEDEFDKWTDSFPPALHIDQPVTKWDEQYPYITFMRWQINIIAYSYKLAPLKSWLVGGGLPGTEGTPLAADFRLKAVGICFGVMALLDKFHDLIFPTNVKYFFVVFFMFDVATVLCSAIVHDKDHTLPQRERIVRLIRDTLVRFEDLAAMTKTAVVQVSVLRKLMARLPLSSFEKTILYAPSPSKRTKYDSPSTVSSEPDYNYARPAVPCLLSQPLEEAPAHAQAPRVAALTQQHTQTPPQDNIYQQPSQPASHQSSDFSFQHIEPADLPPQQQFMVPMPSSGIDDTFLQSQHYLHANAPLSPCMIVPTSQPMQAFNEGGPPPEMMLPQGTMVPLGHLEDMWDWEHLNMDLTRPMLTQAP